MCIIIDANLASLVFSRPTRVDFRPIITWIESKNGILVFGGENARELNDVGDAARRIREWARQGKARMAPEIEVDDRTKKIKALKICVSDDPHIIALAEVTGARVLCSGDVNLHKDFTNHDILRSPRGKVYQRAEHATVLGHCTPCKTWLRKVR